MWSRESRAPRFPGLPRVNSTFLTTSHYAEDFKQGAKIHEAPVRRAGAWALCLKFCCAKPLQNASSYVFWKITVLERKPGEYRQLEGMEMREARRMCFAMT